VGVGSEGIALSWPAAWAGSGTGPSGRSGRLWCKDNPSTLTNPITGTNLTVVMKKKILMATVDTKMKTSVAGIRGVALVAALLVGATLISCGPGGRAPDASGRICLAGGASRHGYGYSCGFYLAACSDRGYPDRV